MERIFFTTTLGELRRRYSAGFLCSMVAAMAGVDVRHDQVSTNVNLLEVFASKFPERFRIEGCAADSVFEYIWIPHPEIQSIRSISKFRTAILKILCETYGDDVELNFEIEVFITDGLCE